MSLVKWEDKDLYDPWGDLKDLQDEINDLFEVDRFPATTGLFDRSLSPALDVIEGDQDFTVRCELPGIEKKDLDVTITSNILTIKGEKKGKTEEGESDYFKKESWSGSFQRTVSLPNTADSEKLSAELKDGILTVKLPKKEEAKPKQISVKIN